jgi:protocatechuate 3,4-dioxygenase beta subunit
MLQDENQSCCQWIKKNILIQQYNKFCILSYSFEDTDKCGLTSSTTEGPFYLENSMIRTDVREDQLGVNLLLRLKVVDVKGCIAIPGLTVDIWHASAYGFYSGFIGYQNIQIPKGRKPVPSDCETFLRGRQYTDEDGMVEFLTIYPGWYTPRTVHFHVKILDDSKEILTTQLFFPQKFTDKIHSLPPYNSRQLSPYTNENDFVLTISHGVQGGWPKLTKLGERCYMGTLTIGVDYLYGGDLG